MTTRDFNQYRQAVSQLADNALSSVDISGTDTGAVTVAVPAARLLLNDDQSLYEPFVSGLDSLLTTRRLADSSGHHREAYHLLAMHLSMTAFSIRYESFPRQLWSICDDWLERATPIVREAETHANVPSDPAEAHLILWRALCLDDHASLSSRDVDIELVDAIVHQIVASPGSDGALTAQDPDESPDAWVYRELVGLHALASLALRRRSRAWADRVEQVALYHLSNTQPDHVTSEPWGVFGFYWSAKTQMFAEQQLHDVRTYGRGVVAGLLLADAANSLNAFC